MVGMLSDIGNTRKVNEDAVGYYEDNNYKIYVIADGMGGHNAGEVASKIAVEHTIQYIKQLKDTKRMEEVLKEAILSSNMEIYKLAQSEDGYQGMGTTITACYICGEEVVIGQVGDSRCYMIKEDCIQRVTKDHSLVQQLLDNGSITETEALHHPNKNIITRALGTNDFVEVDIYTFSVEENVKFMLCTDGLTNELTNEEILEIVLKEGTANACTELVRCSKSKGGRDNISVIVFEGECKDDRNFTRE